MTKLVLKDPQFANLEAASVIRENPRGRPEVTDAELTAIAAHIREPAGGSAAPK